MNKFLTRPVLALAAVGVFTTIVASGCGATSTPSAAGAGAGAAAAKPVSVVAQAAPLDLSDAKLKFTQKGAAVTVSKNGTVVATITLTSATWGATSGHFAFSIDAKQPVRIDTGLFIVYANGGENGADSQRKMNFPAGKSTLTLNFKDFHGFKGDHANPEAIGWVPQNGASGAGVWENPAAAKPPVKPPIKSSTKAAAKPVDLADNKVMFKQKGATATATKNGKVVASLTLTSATWGATSGHFAFSIDAKQPVRIDTGLFIVYANGGENGADSQRKMNFPAGKSTLTLNFKDTHGFKGDHANPEAIGWAAADGDAVWAR